VGESLGEAMQLGQSVVVSFGLALLSLSLHGCSFLKKHSDDTTETTTTSPLTVITTTTTGGGPDPEQQQHCAEWEEGGLICVKCAPGFDLVGGECFYSCITDMDDIKVVNSSGKGMCLDDTTLSNCSDEIPLVWPNTKEPITSLRIFSPWQSSWPEEQRAKAWEHLVKFVRSNGIKVLIGTQITCNETDDDRDWRYVLELMRTIGAEHVMGLAVGNELELLFTKPEVKSDSECIHRLWKGGYFWRKTADRVEEMDMLGNEFLRVPITSVFGGYALRDEPFVNDANAMVASYLANATATFGSRWVFSLNVYPYFDPNNRLDPNSTDQCKATIARCTCMDDARACLTGSVIQVMRRKMQAVTNRTDDLLWIGETGWSHPLSSTLSTPVRQCPAFSSRQTFETYYRNFLSWDLEITGVRGPDHIFYFTMRDSVNFGFHEHFGLVGHCGDTQCKLQRSSNSSSADHRQGGSGSQLIV